MRYKTKVSCIFKIHILFFMTSTLFALVLGESIYLSNVSFYHTRNFCFIKYMPKMSGYPNKSVFMLRIKGGMKKGSQNCFESGWKSVFRLWCIKALFLRDMFSISFKKHKKRGGGTKDKMCFFNIRENFILSSICQNVRVPSTPPPYIKLWKGITPFRNI